MYETHQKRASRSPIDNGINARPTWPPRANRTQPMTAPNSATRASAPSTSWVSTDAVVERPFEKVGSAPWTIPTHKDGDRDDADHGGYRLPRRLPQADDQLSALQRAVQCSRSWWRQRFRCPRRDVDTSRGLSGDIYTP